MNPQPATRATPLVVFRIDDATFALPLHAVEHILWMVDLLPLPEAPGAICGLLNYRGRIVPVADVRRRMGWTPRPFALRDRLILTRGGPRALALAADAVEDVVDVAPELIESASALIPDTPYLQALTTLNGQMVLIQDLERWLSAEEEAYLRDTLESRPEA